MGIPDVTAGLETSDTPIDAGCPSRTGPMVAGRRLAVVPPVLVSPAVVGQTSSQRMTETGAVPELVAAAGAHPRHSTIRPRRGVDNGERPADNIGPWRNRTPPSRQFNSIHPGASMAQPGPRRPAAFPPTRRPRVIGTLQATGPRPGHLRRFREGRSPCTAIDRPSGIPAR